MKKKFRSLNNQLSVLALTVTVFLGGGLQFASALSITSFTADLSLQPYDVDGFGNMANLQKLTIEFDEPVDGSTSGDLFSYIVIEKDNPVIQPTVVYASVTDVLQGSIPPATATKVYLWFGNELKYETDYLLRFLFVMDAQGNQYIETFPDFEFRVPSSNSVPDAANTLSLLAPAAIALFAFPIRR